MTDASRAAERSAALVDEACSECGEHDEDCQCCDTCGWPDCDTCGDCMEPECECLCEGNR